MKEILRSAIYGIYNGSIGLFDFPFYEFNKHDAKNFYEQALKDMCGEIQIMSKEASGACESVIQGLRS